MTEYVEIKSLHMNDLIMGAKCDLAYAQAEGRR